MNPNPLRWGILATGGIAHKFTQGLRALPGAHIQAVASRRIEQAHAFADAYQIPTRHGSYEALAADPEVDIIYVATPHTFHYENTLMCLKQGKHVICEKPVAVSAREAEEMFGLAAEKGLFLMEAMWTRFLPVWVEARRRIAAGEIGDLLFLRADFCFRSSTWDMSDRKFNPDLGGGALLDIGIYPIALAYMLFGEEPVQVTSDAMLGKTGVDEQSAYVFRYAGGQMAIMSSSFHVDGPKEAIVCGTEGSLRVPLFWRGTQLILEKPGQEPLTLDIPFESTGLQYQAAAAMDNIHAGLSVNPIMPPSESLRIMRMMDRLRAEWR